MEHGGRTFYCIISMNVIDMTKTYFAQHCYCLNGQGSKFMKSCKYRLRFQQRLQECADSPS